MCTSYPGSDRTLSEPRALVLVLPVAVQPTVIPPPIGPYKVTEINELLRRP